MVVSEVTSPVREALEEMKLLLVRIYGERLRGVYLYGSHARGEATEDSDVDVLIVLDGPVSFGGIEGIYGVETLPLRWSTTPP